MNFVSFQEHSNKKRGLLVDLFSYATSTKDYDSYNNSNLLKMKPIFPIRMMCSLSCQINDIKYHMKHISQENFSYEWVTQTNKINLNLEK